MISARGWVWAVFRYRIFFGPHAFNRAEVYIISDPSMHSGTVPVLQWVSRRGSWNCSRFVFSENLICIRLQFEHRVVWTPESGSKTFVYCNLIGFDLDLVLLTNLVPDSPCLCDRIRVLFRGSLRYFLEDWIRFCFFFRCGSISGYSRGSLGHWLLFS